MCADPRRSVPTSQTLERSPAAPRAGASILSSRAKPHLQRSQQGQEHYLSPQLRHLPDNHTAALHQAWLPPCRLRALLQWPGAVPSPYQALRLGPHPAWLLTVEVMRGRQWAAGGQWPLLGLAVPLPRAAREGPLSQLLQCLPRHLNNLQQVLWHSPPLMNRLAVSRAALCLPSLVSGICALYAS